MDKLGKAHVFYFSGTGNARRVAMWFSGFAVNSGIECQLTDISKINSKTQVPEHGTLIVIISPVHGFNYPRITLDFIRRFPKGENKVVLMNTRAGLRIGRFITPGLTGISFMLSAFILKKKGYHITGQIPFDMPSNWISIHPALNGKSVKFLHQKNYARLEKHCQKILSGKPDFASDKDIVQDILISPVALAYYLVGRFALAKSFYASPDCDNCGSCIKQCPVKAIRDTGSRPFWTYKCESCMKCMNECPKKAIETAHGLFLTVSLTASFASSCFIHHFISSNIQSGFIRSAIFTSIFMLLLFALYRLQHLFLKTKWIGKLISYSSLTHYKFWGRYRSIPDNKWKDNK
ncbi:EFR1 family ferrodoxin [Dysgonomonas termitidis]|uniref:EFR1 family ferrodoxin n=1 Tax=Dysgonomonas termitidis TaxID=1516126 RepID=A0ABV9KTZ2_9BACT